jgi:hypothetical protein
MKKQEGRTPTAKQVATYMRRTGETNIEQAFNACLKRRNIRRVDLTGRKINIHPATRLDLGKALETLGWSDYEAGYLASQAISSVCAEIVNIGGLPRLGEISTNSTIGSIRVTLREETADERAIHMLICETAKTTQEANHE